jgi:hypothetical protein
MPARMAESLLVDGSTVADLSISIPEGSEPPAVRDLGEHRGERVAPGRSKTHPRG